LASIFRIPAKGNAAKAAEMIRCAVIERVVTRTICEDWYKRFREEDFNLKDEECLKNSTMRNRSIYWIKSQPKQKKIQTLYLYK